MIPLLFSTLILAASSDYVLILPTGERICAKSAETCEVARAAIATGRWPIVPRGTPTRCTPAPGCFEPPSNCISGFNCGGVR